MRATAWESRILRDLLNDPDGTFVVTAHSAKVLHLWALMQQEHRGQMVFADRNEFRDNVFCDCPAERPNRVIPEDAVRVYLHTRGIRWSYVEEPAPRSGLSILEE